MDDHPIGVLAFVAAEVAASWILGVQELLLDLDLEVLDHVTLDWILRLKLRGTNRAGPWGETNSRGQRDRLKI